MTARAPHRLSRFNAVSLALGFAFLYLPIVILVIYSFNASRLVTVWGGWSLRWYTELFNDSAMIEAAWMSFRVAATSATIATLPGTLAAVALSRGARFLLDVFGQACLFIVAGRFSGQVIEKLAREPPIGRVTVAIAGEIVSRVRFSGLPRLEDFGRQPGKRKPVHIRSHLSH